MTGLKFQTRNFGQTKLTFNPKPKPKKERKKILLALLLTVLLPAFLYFRQPVREWLISLNTPQEFQFINPYAEDKPWKDFFGPEVKVESTDDLTAVLEQLVTDLQGRYGIYWEDLASGNKITLKAQESYDAASVVKVVAMTLFYQQVGKGDRSLTETYILMGQDRQNYGSGSIRYQPAGTAYTFAELLDLAGKQSDNTADHIIRYTLGKEAIQEFLMRMKMPMTDLDQVTSTPQEIGQFFTKIYRGEVLEPAYREKLYENLTETLYEDRIPAGIPDRVDVAHKIGNGANRAYNDCGLVFAPRPFVLCVMNQDASERQAQEVIPKIARAAFEWSIRKVEK